MCLYVVLTGDLVSTQAKQEKYVEPATVFLMRLISHGSSIGLQSNLENILILISDIHVSGKIILYLNI